jgi:hypothetical protein
LYCDVALPKLPLDQVRRDAAEVRPVKKVVDFKPKLEIGVFANVRILQQGKIGVRKARVAKAIGEFVALRAKGRNRKSEALNNGSKQGLSRTIFAYK